MRNSWSAYQINTTVAWFGTVVENALDEQMKIGDSRHFEYRSKYTLEQILAPDFRLLTSNATNVVTSGQFVENGAATVLAMASEPRGLVKQYRYVGPSPGQVQ